MTPRISGGRLRGRKLHVPDAAGLRPTPAKAREALFSILGDVAGWRVLDLFAGSGLMAAEALSRGAAEVVSVERVERLCRRMRTLGRDWGLSERWRIERGALPAALERVPPGPFDLVFADPPYDRDVSARIPHWLDERGIRCEHLVIEESARARPAWPEGWTAADVRRYGDTRLHFLERESNHGRNNRP